jgi:hypothetical protein
MRLGEGSNYVVARKYSYIAESIDIFIQVYTVCIHGEDVAETAFLKSEISTPEQIYSQAIAIRN